MKLSILAIVWLALTVFNNSNAQINWYYDLDAAKSVAKYQNKFLLVDFRASWCSPCIKMDFEVWNKERIVELSEKFICVKVDVDYSTNVANRFGINAIPRTMVIDIWDTRMLDRTGYIDKNQMENYLVEFPSDVSEVYVNITKLESNKDDWEAALNAALAYQDLTEGINLHMLRGSLLRSSSSYFKKAQKITKNNPVNYEKVSVYKALSKAHRNNPDKAIKELDKLFETSTGENKPLFQFAYCCSYTLKDDIQKANSYYNQLVELENGKVLLTKLDQLLAERRVSNNR